MTIIDLWGWFCLPGLKISKGTGVLTCLGYMETICCWTGYGFWPRCPEEGNAIQFYSPLS